ncbi:hypothetical protein [Maribellus sediminis]|uniref:hypothetical protein n=1 Tax=Maribellus sediminis TaxID=2696285 RepID=UPI00142FB54B|nr:hypothetical protein [Maribellus sediminis]
MKKHYLNLSIIFLLVTGFYSEKASAGIFSGKIDSIQIVFDKNQLVLPGESFKIGIISFHKKGKTKSTFGLPGGSVFWWKYNTEIIGGDISGAKITVNPQLAPAMGKYISIKVWPKREPEKAQKILIPLNYETNIDFVADYGFDKAPGCFFTGEVVSTFNNGIQVSERVHRYNSKNFEARFVFDGVKLEKGKFQIEPDFEQISGHRVGIAINAEQDKSLWGSSFFELDYKHNYSLDFFGNSGGSGFSGSDGRDGFMGGNGSSGGNGQNGAPGYDGPDVGVWADMYYDSLLECQLLYVYAENFNTGEAFKYLINVDGGKFSVSSKGGSGGSGGNGGDGGNGGRGADGEVWYKTVTKTRTVRKPFSETVTRKVKKRRPTRTGQEEEYEETVTETITVYRDVKETYQVQERHQKPGEKGGHGGDGGAGGLGGPGGWGGNIFLYFTNDAMIYKNLIVANSKGGSGGSNGSGGDGGRGGNGGYGEPNGKNGYSGYDGPYAMGWAPDGRSGDIIIGNTEEFFFYGNTPVDQETTQNRSF